MAQEKYRLELNCTDKGNAALSELISIPADFSTKEAITGFLKTSIVESLQSKGYLAISVDSIIVEKILQRPGFFRRPIQVGELLIDSSILVVESMNRNASQPLPGELLSMASIASLKENMLRNFEENGYPFAAIELDSSYFMGNELCARLRAIKGPLYRIDSLHVEGKPFIKNIFTAIPCARWGRNLQEKQSGCIVQPFVVVGFCKRVKALGSRAAGYRSHSQPLSGASAKQPL